MARIASLLSPYYEKDIPQAVREMDAEDWRQSLAGFPEWAVERAVRWWKGEDNPERRKRPLEGDIAARCRKEMKWIPNAVMMLEARRTGHDFSNKDNIRSEKMSADRAAEIMREVGYEPKRMEG